MIYDNYKNYSKLKYYRKLQNLQELQKIKKLQKITENYIILQQITKITKCCREITTLFTPRPRQFYARQLSSQFRIFG